MSKNPRKVLHTHMLFWYRLTYKTTHITYFPNISLQVGILGVAFIAALTDYCCGLLIYCKYIIIDRAIDEERERGVMDNDELDALRKSLGKSVGYGDIARRAFGV